MNKELFSERLKSLRKEKGYSNPKQFADAYNEKFPPKRRDEAAGNITSGILGTIKHYENPNYTKSMPTLDKVMNMCELLDCDIDYLTGKLDYKTHSIKFICEFTGLSEETVTLLHHLNRSAKPENKRTLTFLNRALSKLDYKEDQDNFFETIFSMLERYVQARNQNFLYISDRDSPNGYNSEVFDLAKSELSLGRASEKLIEILDFPEIYRASIIARVTNLLNEYAQEEEGR